MVHINIMGKSKSIAVKKKQRKRQKQKKMKLLTAHYSQAPEAANEEILNTTLDAFDQRTASTKASDGGVVYDHPVTVRAATVNDSCVHDQPTARTSRTHRDADHNVKRFRAAANRLPPGYNKHTTGVVYYGGIREEDQAKLWFIQSLPLKEQITELQRLFFDRTEAAAYFRDKCVKQEEELEEIQLDFDARIKNVRGFWRDKIYHEHSRGGKLLKLSMQS